MKKLPSILSLCTSLALLVMVALSCASIGSPDGGIYDETPPRMVSSTPAIYSTHIDKKKMSILFNEYIKIEKANENVMVSPPQLEPANIRAEGKRVKIDLYDSLVANTTYTIDFGDAIVDNNEGNPMGFFTYTFSTGDVIDTMEVAGTVINAEDLEPIKGILVGLYPADSAFHDSVFRTKPFARVARTNGSGRFVVKGVKPGNYRVFALDDKDGDMRFTQKSERIAFDTTVITTTQVADVRMDTIWRDSTHYDSIRVVPYTHYLPDDIILKAFLEEGQDHHLLKTERPDPDHFLLYFTAPSDTLPVIRGINFDERCLVPQSTLHNDTIAYWVTDTTYSFHQDTLAFALTYMDTDTTGVLIPRTDTLELVPKVTHKRRRAEQEERIAEWEKDRARRAKKSKKPLPPERNPYLTIPLKITVKPTGTISPQENITFTASEPIEHVDTARTHFYIKQDSNWLPAPYLFLPLPHNTAQWRLYAEWESGRTYRFDIDSTAVRGVLGHVSKRMRQEIRVRSDKEFGSIFVHVITPDTGVVVQLLQRTGKVFTEQRADKDGHADFYFLAPGNYYLRAFIDRNGNNRWDTGEYETHTTPEEVFYFPRPLVLRAQWDMEQEWDLRGIPITRQKPTELTKQKADKKKTIKQRNKERKEKKGGQ